MSSLRALQEYGQSVWLDYIHRALLASGGLQQLIEQDGLRGLTSNPAIFEKAIGSGSDYDDALAAAVRAGGDDPSALFEQLAVADIRAAADILQPVYAATRRRDGYVSLEVSPLLAHDTQGTLAEARRLWSAVQRPNLMIKVPGTAAGVAALRELIREGINVNVTLLFARAAYRAVAEAYLEGLEARAAAGGEVSGVASVASFFVSRIDSAMDAILAERAAAAGTEAGRLQALAGRIAIANAKLAYQDYLGLFEGPRWAALAARGAQTQRLLWASTGTKNPAYRDVLYLEELIGPETVNTVPPATLDAFRDHGVAKASLTAGLDDARQVFAEIAALDLPLDAVTDRLVQEGIALFEDAHNKLLQAVAGKRDRLRG